MRSIIVISALALGFGVLAPRYLSKVGPAPAPAAQEVRTTVATPAGEARPRSVAIARNAQGHFDVDGRVNGRRIDFVVDTGASVVALTARDAARTRHSSVAQCVCRRRQNRQRNRSRRSRPPR